MTEDSAPGLERARALAGKGELDEALALARSFLRANIGHTGALDLIDRLENEGATARDGWRVGSVVAGRWRVLGEAAGGMGRVHFVHDLEWQTELAVKTLIPRGRSEAQATARRLFLREARLWLDLGAHPNIVTAHLVLDLEGELRLFMEYLPDARHVGSTGRPEALPEALDVALQIAAGIEHAHGRGLVHRDLKPQNCLWADDGVRVTDFGLAGPLAERHDAILGDAGGVGTPLYMPPEQWRSLAETGAPADVYAFGLVLFELVSGEHPFDLAPARRRRYRGRVKGALAALIDADELPDDIARHLLSALHTGVAPLDLREIAPHAPAALAVLVARCLAKDPAARPTMSEARAALLALYPATCGRPFLRRAALALPEVDAAESNRACSYVVMGDTAGAIQILDAFLAREPDALATWANRAALAVNAGERSAAAVDVALAGRLGALLNPSASAAPLAGIAADLAPWVIGHAASVAAFSPREAQLAGAHATTSGASCWIHDLRSGSVARWGDVAGEVVALRFDDDGVPFAIGRDRAGLGLHVRGTETRALGRLLAVGPRGHCLIDAGGGEVASVDPRDGRVLARFRHGVRAGVRCLFALDADGARLCVADEEGRPRLRVLDARGGEAASLSMRGWPTRIAVLPADRLVVHYGDGLLRVVDLGEHRVLGEHHGDPGALVCDPDAGRIVLAQRERVIRGRASGAGTLLVIDVASGGSLAVIPTRDDSQPLAISRDGAWIAARSEAAARTRLWPEHPRPPERSLRTHFVSSLAAQSRVERRTRHEVLCAALDRAPGPGPWRALAALRDATPELQSSASVVARCAHACAPWAISRGVRRSFRAWSRPTPEVTAVAASASGAWIASAHADRSLRVWSLDGDLLARLDLPGAASALAVAPDDAWLVAAGGGGAPADAPCPLLAIDATTWTTRWTLAAIAHAVAVSPDGAFVAAATREGGLLMVGGARGDRRASPPGEADAVGWRPTDGTLTTASGPLVAHAGRSIGGAEAYISRLAWSSDGRRLAAGDRLWAFAGAAPGLPQPIAALWPDARGAPVLAHAFVAEGRVLVAARAFGVHSPEIAWIDVRARVVRAVMQLVDARELAVGGSGAIFVARTARGVELWGVEHDWAFAEDLLASSSWEGGSPSEIAEEAARLARRPGLAPEWVARAGRWSDDEPSTGRTR